MNFILLDTSYLIFYRYYALIQWWKHAKPDSEPLTNPYENAEFVEKFCKMFIESIINIKKKLKLHKTGTRVKKADKDKPPPPPHCCVIAARDCPRQEIWRNELYSKYKEQRYKDNSFMGGEFFKHVYNTDLLFKAGVDHIFKFPNLEGDDLVAITKIWLRNKYPDAAIYIIANDHDYLQLVDERTTIMNLKFKNLYENPKIHKDPAKNLFYKVVLGDKSDNIEPVFKKCGPKTAEKYYEDHELFETALEKQEVRERYELNKKLVSFSEIPTNLVQLFIEKYQEIFAVL